MTKLDWLFRCVMVATAGLAGAMYMTQASSETSAHAAQQGGARGGRLSDVAVAAPWSPVAPPNVPVAAGYFRLENRGDVPLVLIGAMSPEYQHVEMHRSAIRGGMASMEAVTDLVIAPGATVDFSPGGLHLMLRNGRRALQAGDSFPVMLHFANGQHLNFEVTVSNEPPAGQRQVEAVHEHHHGS